MKKNVKTIVTVGTILLAVLVVLGGCSSKQNAKPKQARDDVTVELTYKPYEKTAVTKKYTVAKGTNLAELITDKLNAKIEKGFVTSVANIKQNKVKGLYWTYKLDGKSATAAAKTVILKPAQKITFEMVKF
ncbi:DUF4430 domain-containing protein [Periweissella cryptocerci]|uniref:DUF4430 domain-containing protein n=1 Tax=Periweissella cryptocerci TaxID=2506420 RepID=A0A4P6YT76_9LACO|nr:DUF4430 domain-containing protein [Periweissella cryptocerci]QBO35944.1 DUF4430 domain-containing protein [Periweissella cryptocerci]